VPQVLKNIESLASVLADRRGQIGSLLTSTSQVTDVIHAQQASLGTLVRDGRDLLQEITSRRETVDLLLTATTELVHQLRGIVVHDRPDIDELLTSLDGLLQTLSNNDQLLRNSVQILPVPLRNFTNATGTANEMDFNAPAGPLIDSWVCAISGRADQLNLPPYLRDCK
jgi:ABC-type transporter Mla subunit MlaD